VDRGDETHDDAGFDFPRAAPTPAAWRFSRSFFLRLRSFRQRLSGLEPRPMGWGLYTFPPCRSTQVEPSPSFASSGS
jgi:hypothetical protein